MSEGLFRSQHFIPTKVPRRMPYQGNADAVCGVGHLTICGERQACGCASSWRQATAWNLVKLDEVVTLTRLRNDVLFDFLRACHSRLVHERPRSVYRRSEQFACVNFVCAFDDHA